MANVSTCMIYSIPHKWKQNNTNKWNWHIQCNRCSLQNNCPTRKFLNQILVKKQEKVTRIMSFKISFYYNLENNKGKKRKEKRDKQVRGWGERSISSFLLLLSSLHFLSSPLSILHSKESFNFGSLEFIWHRLFWQLRGTFKPKNDLWVFHI